MPHKKGIGRSSFHLCRIKMELQLLDPRAASTPAIQVFCAQNQLQRLDFSLKSGTTHQDAEVHDKDFCHCWKNQQRRPQSVLHYHQKRLHPVPRPVISHGCFKATNARRQKSTLTPAVFLPIFSSSPGAPSYCVSPEH